MKNIMTGTYFFYDESFNFKFRTDLTTSEKMRFVNSVVNTIVDDEYYNSVLRNLIFDYMLIKVFTNINTFEIDNSDTIIDDIEEFLKQTDIVDVIKANAKVGLIEELNNAVDKSIEYRTGVHPNQLNEALSRLVNTLENKINQIDLNSMMEMANKFAGMTDELTPESIVNAYIATKK